MSVSAKAAAHMALQAWIVAAGGQQARQKSSWEDEGKNCGPRAPTIEVESDSDVSHRGQMFQREKSRTPRRNTIAAYF